MANTSRKAHIILNVARSSVNQFTYLSNHITAFKSRWFVGSSNSSKVGSMNKALNKIKSIRRLFNILF